MQPSTWLQSHLTDDDVTSDIAEMVKEKGKTCASIIVPTHRSGQDRQGDRLEVQRAVDAAKQAVLNTPGDFSLAIDSLLGEIDFKRNKEGVGIFVSPRVRKLVRFPFPVTKKIVVDEFFHLNDLLYVENYRTAYYLLDISRKEIHLFRGMIDRLEEIEDENFPMQIAEEYEYNKPGPSGSGTGRAQVKDVEKDKSILVQARMKKTFQQADKLLSKYIVKNDIPLLLCGPEKNISIYRSITHHADNIVSFISNNSKSASIHDLAILAWQQIKSFLDEQKLKLVNDFKEKVGKVLAVSGVEEIWTAAEEGRGLILLVEKDYGKAAFVTKDNKLSLQQAKEKDVKHPDVVNEIINTVLEKNGKVVIVENDILKEYERIALILRY